MAAVGALRPIGRARQASNHLDTVRALCHDLRQPVTAILLPAGADSCDTRRRMDGILDQAQWLAEMVEGVIGDAAQDAPRSVDVVDLASGCVRRAQHTADCQIEFSSTDRAMVRAAPLALSRAVSCVLDNAVRAASPGGHVTVDVTGTACEIVIRVSDDGPGLGHVPTHNSLGLPITRALVCACGGGFELKPGQVGGMVALIVLPVPRSKRVPG